MDSVLQMYHLVSFQAIPYAYFIIAQLKSWKIPVAPLQKKKILFYRNLKHYIVHRMFALQEENKLPSLQEKFTT